MASRAEQAAKVEENRLRRVAKRQGLRLEKSRRRDQRATEYGRYRLVDIQTGSPRPGSPEDYRLSLDEIRVALRE